jgi:3-isopropylmalate/(R)-2-methylmalate dehydratase large subunit
MVGLWIMGHIHKVRMTKRTFTTLASRAVPLPLENIDTDQILPARYLKATTREGFADKLFRDWRFTSDGEKKDFVLNDERYTGQILVAGRNFATGSSREHAVWALYDYGFRVVVSSFFADIFKANALNNSLLPVVVSQKWLEALLEQIQRDPETIVRIDLPKQSIECDAVGMKETFEIDPYKKECIMFGLDDVDYILSHKEKILAYERNRSHQPLRSERPKTLVEKLWDSHVVYQKDPTYPAILYIDVHLVHEVTSPQAFDGLRSRKIPVFRPENTWATADHNVPTLDQHLPIKEALSRKQVEMLDHNVKEFGIRYYGLGHPWQGIVHVIGPELGITQPGKTIVCGDSHTSTHGAFGAYAFGIGTSEVEQVLATQCILQRKPKTMKIEVNGSLGKGVTPKDVILYIIAKLTASGGTGYFVEYAGGVFKNMSMEQRMTVCNMSIEMGARGGIIAPDEKTYAYIKGREFAPSSSETWEKVLAYWKSLPSDEGAKFDRVEVFDAHDIEPMITYGTNPGMGMKIGDRIPLLRDQPSESARNQLQKSLLYMGFREGQKVEGQKVDYVFFGSCTNSRIEDFREAAKILRGRKKAPNVFAYLVPGSTQVLQQAKKEGLDKVFADAGFELRGAGCSACLGMNEDKIPSGKYCLSTSNRNFEGRQGPGARTMLASPLTAAATAVRGVVTDPREFL